MAAPEPLAEDDGESEPPAETLGDMAGEELAVLGVTLTDGDVEEPLDLFPLLQPASNAKTATPDAPAAAAPTTPLRAPRV